MSKVYPSHAAERFIVRLPDGMRDRIAAEAEANKRSMNAEIVARLEASFAGSGPSDETMIYAVLDTDGMPISFHEIVTHLGEITRAAGASPVSVRWVVLTPEMLSSKDRLDEDERLMAEYAKRRRAARKTSKA